MGKRILGLAVAGLAAFGFCGTASAEGPGKHVVRIEGPHRSLSVGHVDRPCGPDRWGLRYDGMNRDLQIGRVGAQIFGLEYDGKAVDVRIRARK